jgi:outer membrane receptor for ferrienterochelin and colicins
MSFLIARFAEPQRYRCALAFIVALTICLLSSRMPCGAATDSDSSRPSIADLSIEQLMEVEVATVYGASKFEQKITEAPSSVSIVSDQDIRRYGYRTLADILRGVRGFFTSYDRTYEYIGVRGFSRPGDYNTRILLLVDGHKINDNIYNTATIGNEFILDVDLIDRVEVIRGPGSSLYGSNAFFGVISITTKRPEKYNGFEVSASAGSFDTYKQRATFGKKFSDSFELLLSGSHSTSNGQSLYFQEFNTPATNNGRADSCDQERYGNLLANIKIADFTLQGAYVSRDKGIPTAPYGTVFNDNHTRVNDARAYIDLKYEKLLAGTTNIKARASYDYYDYSGNYLYNNPPFSMNKDRAAGQWWGSSLELTRTFFGKHKVIAGMEYQDNYLQKQRNYDQVPFAQYLNDGTSSYYWAAHIQDQFSILDNLSLNAGVRYDYYQTFGSNVSPRIGLIYHPFEKTTLKLLYGEAFRAPNAFELYYADGGLSQMANPRLNPEKIQTYEFILEQYVKNYRFTASTYYYRINDLISLQTDPASGLSVYRNTGEVESKGAEFEIEGKWAHGIEGRASFSLQQSTDKDTGRMLTNSPKQLGKLGLFVPIIPQKLSTGLEVQYTGWQRTVKGDVNGGFVTANLTILSRELIKNLEISGSIYNLLDQKYGNPAPIENRQSVIWQDGRSFRLKLTYRF